MPPLYGPEGDEWNFKDIIDETKTHYKFVWDGIDPETGRPYKNIWV